MDNPHCKPDDNPYKGAIHYSLANPFRIHTSTNRLKIGLRLEQLGEAQSPSQQEMVGYAVILGYTIDAMAERSPSVSYSNSMQANLNGYYKSTNSGGRSALVESAKLMNRNPDTRIEKDGTGYVSVPKMMRA